MAAQQLCKNILCPGILDLEKFRAEIRRLGGELLNGHNVHVVFACIGLHGGLDGLPKGIVVCEECHLWGISTLVDNADVLRYRNSIHHIVPKGQVGIVYRRFQDGREG